MNSFKRIFILSLVCLLILTITISANTVGGTDAGRPDDSDGSSEDSFIPDGFSSWEEYFEYLMGGGNSKLEVPPLEEMRKVAENNKFTLYYFEDGADIYILDKRNNKVWSNAVDSGYSDVSNYSPSLYSTLLNVGVAKENDEFGYYSLVSNESNSDFNVTTEFENNGLLLHLEVKNTGLSFDFKITLDEDGITYSLPIESLKEDDKSRLVCVDVFPTFGAARSDEKGYIFYPDGSGALIEFKNYDQPNAKQYQYRLYGLQDQDIKSISKNNELDNKSIMLPVFGIKHTDRGVFAVILEGDNDATLNVAMPGYQLSGLYRAYYSFDYRTYATVVYDYTGSQYDIVKVNKLVPDLIKKTHTVKYYLLDESECDYSSMAVKYRSYLEQSGILKASNRKSGIPLSIEFFMGISSKGLFVDSLAVLTTFEQAQNIMEDLKASGVSDMSALLTGWGKGGFDTLPSSPKPDSKLGGSKGLSKLGQFAFQNGIDIFARMDFINADSKTGSFNKRNDTIRDYLSKLVTDNQDENIFLLNPVKSFKKYLPTALKKLPANINISLAEIGSKMVYDYNRSSVLYGDRIIETYKSGLQSAATTGKKVAVSGGNSYVFQYVNRMYDIPDNDSNYFENDKAVPFYQMVVHGYMDYTSLAGNMSYNYDYQKLRWIESGSIPHFLITYENPILLKDTSYNKIFSSEYNVWKDKILQIYEEFNQNLKDVWGLKINRHETISDGVVQVTYEDSSKVLINYNSKDVQVGNETIPAMSYVVVRGK